MFNYFRCNWQDKSSYEIAKLSEISSLFLQGGPGSAGAKGESGDPGPQVRNQNLSFYS